MQHLITNRRYFKSCLLASLCLFGSTSIAGSCSDQLSGTVYSSDMHCVFVGVAAGSEHNYYDIEESIAVPSLTIIWDYAYLNSDEVGFYFAGNEWSNGYWVASAHVAYQAAPFSHDDHKRFKALPEKEDTVVAGGRIATGGAWGKIELSSKSDIGDEKSGAEYALRYSITMDVDQFSITPFIGVTHFSERKADYLFSVPKKWATEELLAFDSDAGNEYVFGANALYELDSRWTLFSSVQFSSLEDNLKNSPLVTNDNKASGFVGVYYRF